MPGVDGAAVALPAARGEPRLTLLSPTKLQLDRLFVVWDREIAALQAKGTACRGNSRHPRPAARPEPNRSAVPGHHAHPARPGACQRLQPGLPAGAPRCQLLAADAHAPVLAAALRTLALQRQVPLPLKVDAFKLNHHGSRGNVTRDLLDTVQATHYVVSTNGVSGVNYLDQCGWALIMVPEVRCVAGERATQHGVGSCTRSSPGWWSGERVCPRRPPSWPCRGRPHPRLRMARWR